MKLRPQCSEHSAQYPTLKQHKRVGGDFLRAAVALGLGAAFGTSALAGQPHVAGGMPVRPKPPVVRPAGPSAKKTEALAKQVVVLTNQLGSPNFKLREAATVQLIALGRGNGKCKATDLTTRQLVSASMTKCAKHEDPEVRERARRILLALTPPKKVVRPPRPGVELDGFIVIEPRAKGGR
jgi:hypothetical protein